MQLIPDNKKRLRLSRKDFHETSKSRRYLQNMYLEKIFAFHRDTKYKLEHLFD